MLCRRSVLGAALLAVIAAGGVAAGAERDGLTKEGLQRLYMAYLADEGYRPSIDEDGDIQFKREGYTLYIGVDAEDTEFFRVFNANIWEIESADELARARMAADHATRVTKVSKVFLTSDLKDVWVSTELFLARPEDFKPVFERSLRALDYARNEFLKRMKE